MLHGDSSGQPRRSSPTISKYLERQNIAVSPKKSGWYELFALKRNSYAFPNSGQAPQIFHDHSDSKYQTTQTFTRLLEKIDAQVSLIKVCST